MCVVAASSWLFNKLRRTVPQCPSARAVTVARHDKFKLNVEIVMHIQVDDSVKRVLLW